MLHLIKHPHHPTHDIGQIPQGMESLGMLLFPDSNTIMGPRSFFKGGRISESADGFLHSHTDEPLVLNIAIDKV